MRNHGNTSRAIWMTLTALASTVPLAAADHEPTHLPVPIIAPPGGVETPRPPSGLPGADDLAKIIDLARPGVPVPVFSSENVTLYHLSARSALVIPPEGWTCDKRIAYATPDEEDENATGRRSEAIQVECIAPGSEHLDAKKCKKPGVSVQIWGYPGAEVEGKAKCGWFKKAECTAIIGGSSYGFDDCSHIGPDANANNLKCKSKVKNGYATSIFVSCSPG